MKKWGNMYSWGNGQKNSLDAYYVKNKSVTKFHWNFYALEFNWTEKHAISSKMGEKH